jgi:hypothetical protein
MSTSTAFQTENIEIENIDDDNDDDNDSKNNKLDVIALQVMEAHWKWKYSSTHS